ncbi:hypothetical protein L208DRAFT_1380750 [Tricholoma matsutake]|nr:hypothetical protein L208DRAFT_1380750 [Tricholoma matsutake 945]
MPDSRFIDDSDPGIKYSADWFIGGGSGDADGTTHGTMTAGATASFTFTGTHVEVFGTIGTASSTDSTYSVDGSSNITFSATPRPGQTGDLVHQQLFYQSPELADRQHTLVITSTSVNNSFWIDYILYTPSTNSTTTDAPRPSPTTVFRDFTITPTDTQITSDNSTSTNRILSSGTSAPSASNAALPQIISKSRPREPSTAIVGAVVGVVVVLLIGGFLIWRSCRRTSGHLHGLISGKSQIRSPPLTPFTISAPTRPPQAYVTMPVSGNSHCPDIQLRTFVSPFYATGLGSLGHYTVYTTHGSISREKLSIYNVPPFPTTWGSVNFQCQALPSHPRKPQNLQGHYCDRQVPPVSEVRIPNASSHLPIEEPNYDVEAHGDSPPAYQTGLPTPLAHESH